MKAISAGYFDVSYNVMRWHENYHVIMMKAVILYRWKLSYYIDESYHVSLKAIMLIRCKPSYYVFTCYLSGYFDVSYKVFALKAIKCLRWKLLCYFVESYRAISLKAIVLFRWKLSCYFVESHRATSCLAIMFFST